MKKLLLISIISFYVNFVHAQWTQTNGPFGGAINCIVTKGSNTFAATSCGVFLSTNNGTSWAPVNNGLINPNVLTLTVKDSNIFAGTAGSGLFISNNNGTSWSAINDGFPVCNVNAIALSGTTIFAGTNLGVFKAVNNGNSSWNLVNNGLTNTNILSLAIKDTNIFAGTDNGLFLSKEIHNQP